MCTHCVLSHAMTNTWCLCPVELLPCASPYREMSANSHKIDFASFPNERYALDAPSSKDHDNEDDILECSNNFSACLCVFDGHDGILPTKFVKKYLNGWVFGKDSWHHLIASSDNPRQIENALIQCFSDTEENFFKSIDPFIFEKRQLQSRIPEVIYFYPHLTSSKRFYHSFYVV